MQVSNDFYLYLIIIMNNTLVIAVIAVIAVVIILYYKYTSTTYYTFKSSSKHLNTFTKSKKLNHDLHNYNDDDINKYFDIDNVKKTLNEASNHNLGYNIYDNTNFFDPHDKEIYFNSIDMTNLNIYSKFHINSYETNKTKDILLQYIIRKRLLISENIINEISRIISTINKEHKLNESQMYKIVNFYEFIIILEFRDYENVFYSFLLLLEPSLQNKLDININTECKIDNIVLTNVKKQYLDCKLNIFSKMFSNVIRRNISGIITNIGIDPLLTINLIILYAFHVFKNCIKPNLHLSKDKIQNKLLSCPNINFLSTDDSKDFKDSNNFASVSKLINENKSLTDKNQMLEDKIDSLLGDISVEGMNTPDLQLSDSSYPLLDDSAVLKIKKAEMSSLKSDFDAELEMRNSNLVDQTVDYFNNIHNDNYKYIVTLVTNNSPNGISEFRKFNINVDSIPNDVHLNEFTYKKSSKDINERLDNIYTSNKKVYIEINNFYNPSNTIDDIGDDFNLNLYNNLIINKLGRRWLRTI